MRGFLLTFFSYQNTIYASMKKKPLVIIYFLVIFLIAITAIAIFYKFCIVTKTIGVIPSKEKTELIKWFPFSEENCLKEWEEKIFKGKVVYKIEKNEDLAYVRAKSSAAASALYYKIKLDAKKRHPVISWKWKVDKFPLKKSAEALDKQDVDDYAARVYVIFLAKFILNSKVIEYIWSETLPVGATGSSPYSDNIKLIVVASGKTGGGGWRFEDRDIIADYVKAFGKAPERDIGAIAFMTNTEHTGSSADAMYDDIKLGYREDSDRKTKGEVAP